MSRGMSGAVPNRRANGPVRRARHSASYTCQQGSQRGCPGGRGVCTRVLENYDFDRFQKLLRHDQAAEAFARAAAGVTDDVGVADI